MIFVLLIYNSTLITQSRKYYKTISNLQISYLHDQQRGHKCQLQKLYYTQLNQPQCQCQCHPRTEIIKKKILKFEKEIVISLDKQHSK